MSGAEVEGVLVSAESCLAHCRAHPTEPELVIESLLLSVFPHILLLQGHLHEFSVQELSLRGCLLLVPRLLLPNELLQCLVLF